ncbi:hypothetical protein FC34_GL001545 [Lacticaseibacillus brantae DSM 23927]|uniref:Uncharacterized protein n=2 Tax=Lacticaseibacillus brantae TaxID=943673 RepID=A0A0R2B5B8_9LACO|nr:hypothetical protein FC34_GL001545 [Lacticaseibacillus brantae DSM 23927]
MPIGHDHYKISDFKMYQELKYESGEIYKRYFPDWIVGIDPTKLTSEPTAQAVADVTGMLKIVMGVDDPPISTLSGKKGTGTLDFDIETFGGPFKSVEIDGWQSEIDGLYETEDTALILESKMKAPKDFNVRQIYIPTLIYQQMLKERNVHKRILAAYFIYSNDTFIFNLYEFKDLTMYNSLELKHQFRFRLSEGEVFSMPELSDLTAKTQPIGEPANDADPIPFPQANNVYVMSDLIESLQAPKVVLNVDGQEETFTSGTTEAFVAQNKYSPRQAGYYYNVLRYFGFADKDATGIFKTTSLGTEYAKATGSKRTELMAAGLLRSAVFNSLIELQLKQTEPLTDEDIIQVMKDQRLQISESTMKRRSSTVRALIGYLFDNLD